MDMPKPSLPSEDVDPVNITVRFSASLPDLLLTIETPTIATAATLKQHIRKHLPPSLSDRRIRLIYAGRALLDTTDLSTQLRLSSSRTTSRAPTPLPSDRNNSVANHKGKTPIYDRLTPTTNLYVHCSIGDVTLSRSDLALETAQSTLLSNSTSTSSTANRYASSSNRAPSAISTAGPSSAINTASTTPAPRGFDRLLNAGFSPDEVRTLRSQFMAIQAHSHTPDTMPTADQLRDMEDRWLDNDTSNTGIGTGPGSSSVGAGEVGTGIALAADEDASGALDDLLWGAVMGFFWPVGCLWWACREEGIWSRRKKWAIVLGLVINAGVGGLRWLS